MGSTSYGQQGSCLADGKIPICVRGNIADSCMEEIACGSHHVAVLTSKAEVYTWGKGFNGQLGHGDNGDQITRKSLKASLAPSANKPYRVCDDCFTKLQKTIDSASVHRIPNVKTGGLLNKPSESTEKESGGVPRISRLSSAESFKSDRNSTFNNAFSIAISCTGEEPRRSTTPSPSTSLSFRTSEANPDDVKFSNDSLSLEVKSLRAQVENLTSKSQLLEAELERKSKQLKEMTARAADEAEKSKAAKEVIKSLTIQLKEMAEKVPEDQVACSHLDANEQVMNDFNRPSNGSSVTSITSPKSESSDNSNTPPLPNGTKGPLQKSKRIIQDEPGVYITLVTLPNGVNELRRVRFSRKRFTEDQAEKWWAENGTRVCERHNVRTLQ
ncbi:hypothetical protein DH2020_003363 [Rehmannia glutinosa]|uniref:BRX domain-containing protein n=1 Tax=Rehmannia glutinosa TaxID=99300 RepID=A0ABR0XLE5_REHGL